MNRRPEILQAGKNVETSELNVKFAKISFSPRCRCKARWGSRASARLWRRHETKFRRRFLQLRRRTRPQLSLGNRSAYSTYNKRQLESRNAQSSLQSVRQQVIVGVREAVRRVHRLQTD